MRLCYPNLNEIKNLNKFFIKINVIIQGQDKRIKIKSELNLNPGGVKECYRAS